MWLYERRDVLGPFNAADPPPVSFCLFADQIFWQNLGTVSQMLLCFTFCTARTHEVVRNSLYLPAWPEAVNASWVPQPTRRNEEHPSDSL
jgi:hypothetical protein